VAPGQGTRTSLRRTPMNDELQCKECGRHLPADKPAYDVNWSEDTPNGTGDTGNIWLCHECINILPGAP
jgi:hypothetical protein